MSDTQKRTIAGRYALLSEGNYVGSIEDDYYLSDAVRTDNGKLVSVLLIPTSTPREKIDDLIIRLRASPQINYYGSGSAKVDNEERRYFVFDHIESRILDSVLTGVSVVPPPPLQPEGPPFQPPPARVQTFNWAPILLVGTGAVIAVIVCIGLLFAGAPVVIRMLATATPTVTYTPTPTRTSTPTITPTFTPTPTRTYTPTLTLTPSTTPTLRPPTVPTVTPTLGVTATSTITATRSVITQTVTAGTAIPVASVTLTIAPAPTR